MYAVQLSPEDGLYPLPYAARQADGSPWQYAGTDRLAGWPQTRQTFFPDTSRLYEEINRFGSGPDGRVNLLTGLATFEHVRAAPSGGYRQGPESEVPGEDFFNYQPFHLRTDHHLGSLAAITNVVQRTLDRGAYCGAQWLEGSSTTEETLYWLGLLVDSTVPIVGHVAQRMHQVISADGARNLLDGVRYLTSGIALDEQGRDASVRCSWSMRSGSRLARRPRPTPGRETSWRSGDTEVWLPTSGSRAHGSPASRCGRTPGEATCASASCPDEVNAVVGSLDGVLATRVVQVRRPDRSLVASALPRVSVVTYGRYQQIDADTDPRRQSEIMAALADHLGAGALGGFAEGMSVGAIPVEWLTIWDPSRRVQAGRRSRWPGSRPPTMPVCGPYRDQPNRRWGFGRTPRQSPGRSQILVLLLA